MNAVEYFKKNGFNKSKIHLDIMNAENWHNGFYSDLKRLVESYELVMEFGNNETYLKNYLTKNPKVKGFYLDSWCQTFSRDRLEQAIADVEKCQ